MGFFGSLFGQDGAGAARDAAADQFAKQSGAGTALRDYGDSYAKEFAGLSHSYDPYRETGAISNNALQRLLMDPSSVRTLPGYQFAQDEGLQALDRSAAAGGRLNSGRSAKDLLRFSTGLADQNYGSHLQRLMSGTSLGMGATQAGIGTTAQGLQGQMATRQSSYGGDMGAAGTIGQGMIGAQNAENAGTQNAINIGMKGIGMLMGGGMPSFGAASPMSLGSAGGTGLRGYGGLY